MTGWGDAHLGRSLAASSRHFHDAGWHFLAETLSPNHFGFAVLSMLIENLRSALRRFTQQLAPDHQPVPFMFIWAPIWKWVIAANALLGINQGLAWSMT
jgi:hypothetical protein